MHAWIKQMRETQWNENKNENNERHEWMNQWIKRIECADESTPMIPFCHGEIQWYIVFCFLRVGPMNRLL